MAKKAHPKEVCPFCEKSPCECETKLKASVHKVRKNAAKPKGGASG